MSWTITPGETLDPDAVYYIGRVEAADGQALEPAVVTALDAFVKGCKADGIWSAIKASCILAGARTTNGALVPLKGTAPTPVNFDLVNNTDYLRKTGLMGNGTTKYLNSNRSITDDLQNNAHIAVYQSTAASSNANVFMTHIGAVDANNIVSHIAEGFPSSFDVKIYRLQSPVSLAGLTKTSANNANGLQGVSRSAPGSFNFRAGRVNTSITSTSGAHVSGNYFVLAQNNTGTAASHSNARLAFYSIGESLDLALLDARVTTLINAFSTAIP
jgi:hypothetical protein